MVEIRLARAEDLEAIAALVNVYVVEGYSHLGTTPLTVEDVHGFAQDPMHACFVACEQGEVLGAAWSAKHKTREAYDWTVDLAVYLRASAQGRRVGGRLQARVVECLRLQGYVSALAVIVMPNPASVALHEGLGFERVGVMPNMGFKLGQWRDVGVWHLRLVTPSNPPPRPRPVAEVLEDPPRS